MAVICEMFQRGGVDSHLFDPLVRVGLQHAQSRVHVDTQQSSYQINGCKTYVPHKHRVNHYHSIHFSCFGVNKIPQGGNLLDKSAKQAQINY